MKNIIDILLDQSNTEPIALVDNTGRVVNFEQVAVIPHNGVLYCVLKPLDTINGIEEDEAVVFFVSDGEDGEPMLEVETDEEIAIEIFNQYYDLIEEEERKEKK